MGFGKYSFILLLSGCAISPSGVGNAQYQYSNGQCNLTVNSARSLEQADITITPDCAVSVQSAGARVDGTYLGIISKLAGLLSNGE